MSKQLIQDQRFKVAINENSKQNDPDLCIWSAAHVCVDGGSNPITTCTNPVQSIIKNALKYGHFEVLQHASIKVDFKGFPHDTAVQMRTHRSAHVLVQSLRYSDEQFTACAKGDIDPRDLFYFPPCKDVEQEIHNYKLARRSCMDYANAIDAGAKKEDARRYLIAGYRQGFTISATFCTWFHIFDRRLLADTQVEARTASWMALDCLCEYSEFFQYYKETRAGRNHLSP